MLPVGLLLLVSLSTPRSYDDSMDMIERSGERYYARLIFRNPPNNETPLAPPARAQRTA